MKKNLLVLFLVTTVAWGCSRKTAAIPSATSGSTFSSTTSTGTTSGTTVAAQNNVNKFGKPLDPHGSRPVPPQKATPAKPVKQLP